MSTPGGYWKPGPNERRTRPLPRGWKKLKAQVFARDGHRCTVVWGEQAPCGSTVGLECNHVCHEVGCPGCDDPAHLVTVCRACHRKITGLQAGRASAEKRQSRARPAERHPGLLE